MTRLLAAFLALLALPALAAEKVTTFTLDNGMDVVVIEDHRAPVVVHMVWYRTGAADEPAGQSGIAHFLEHLMFKGTDDYGPGEMSDIIAANGGSDNAFTSWDYTAYFQRIAADRLDLMMRMEADRMTDLVLSPADIRTERDVILEERNQRVDNNPNALMREQMRAAQYLNHPYGVPIIGWRHEMEGLDMDAALAFYDRFYAPNNAILVVAGDVEPDQVRALADTHYGPIPANPDLMPRTRIQEPPQLAERRIVFADPRIAQPYLARSYLAPERDPGDQGQAAALTYLAELIGGSPFTSTLGVALQFDSQVAVYSNAFYDGLILDDGTFGLTVVPAEGVTLQEAEDAMDAAIAAFLDGDIDPARIEAIRTQFRASEIYALDNVMGLAQRYGSALTSGLTVEDVQAWPQALQDMTEADIRAAAEAVLNRDRAVTAWVVPSRELLQ